MAGFRSQVASFALLGELCVSNVWRWAEGLRRHTEALTVAVYSD